MIFRICIYFKYRFVRIPFFKKYNIRIGLSAAVWRFHIRTTKIPRAISEYEEQEEGKRGIIKFSEDNQLRIGYLVIDWDTPLPTKNQKF